MKRTRDLLVANGAGLLVVVVAYLLGWREAATYGLVVLALLDVIVLVRERSRPERDGKNDSGTTA
jgi:Flp pilus assembly protein TadB